MTDPLNPCLVTCNLPLWPFQALTGLQHFGGKMSGEILKEGIFTHMMQKGCCILLFIASCVLGTVPLESPFISHSACYLSSALSIPGVSQWLMGKEQGWVIRGFESCRTRMGLICNYLLQYSYVLAAAKIWFQELPYAYNTRVYGNVCHTHIYSRHVWPIPWKRVSSSRPTEVCMMLLWPSLHFAMPSLPNPNCNILCLSCSD